MENEEKIDDETYVPLKEKRAIQNRKIGILILTLIILGTALFFSVVMLMRSGGPFKVLFVLLSLAIGYLMYEAIMKYKSINKT
ncbi:MAG: hypothetical protein AB8B53_14645 [Flavobacteriales bacterium]